MIRALFRRGRSVRQQLADALQAEAWWRAHAQELNDRLTRLERASSERVRKGNATRRARVAEKAAVLRDEVAQADRLPVAF